MDADTRCPDCDAPLATQADFDGHSDGCACERCTAICWRAWNANVCLRDPVDWRAQARALRRERDDARMIVDGVARGVLYMLSNGKGAPGFLAWNGPRLPDIRAPFDLTDAARAALRSSP